MLGVMQSQEKECEDWKRQESLSDVVLRIDQTLLLVLGVLANY